MRELATQLRHDGVDARLDHWHAVPGDQLPVFMESEIRDNDYVLIICTPRYKEKSDKRIGGVGYEGDIMTGEVFTKQNDRKFIPVLAKGTWDASARSWLKSKYYIDLATPSRYEAEYDNLLTTILGTRSQPPPLGPLPTREASATPNQSAERVRSMPQVNFELFDRRLQIHDAAMRLIAHVMAKGTCAQEELDQFLKATKDARFLFNEDIEGYLRTLAAEALYVCLGRERQEGLAHDPRSEEFQKSVDAWGDRLVWFTQQPDEVKKRFDSFLQIRESAVEDK